MLHSEEPPARAPGPVRSGRWVGRSPAAVLCECHRVSRRAGERTRDRVGGCGVVPDVPANRGLQRVRSGSAWWLRRVPAGAAECRDGVPTSTLWPGERATGTPPIGGDSPPTSGGLTQVHHTPWTDLACGEPFGTKHAPGDHGLSGGGQRGGRRGRSPGPTGPGSPFPGTRRREPVMPTPWVLRPCVTARFRPEVLDLPALNHPAKWGGGQWDAEAESRAQGNSGGAHSKVRAGRPARRPARRRWTRS